MAEKARKERLLDQVVIAADTDELDLLKEKLTVIQQYDNTPQG